MPFVKFNDEVFYCGESVAKVSIRDIMELKRLAENTERRRSRLCTHPDIEDSVHEMFIVHERGTYVRPHKHLDRCESFHVVEGQVDVVVFTDNGDMQRRIKMSDYASGEDFYFRLSEPVYHTVLVQSDVVVFHETTNGPFRPARTVFPTWSPAEDDVDGVEEFMRLLYRKVGT